MGNYSAQGWAVLVLLTAFVWLSLALFNGGSAVFLALAALTMGGAIAIFLKIKPLEEQAAAPRRNEF
jgi:hypothetical protein